MWEEQGFEPISVGGMVTIYDAHHVESAETFSTPICIGIQARNTFGTGNHETTRMIVATLLELPLQDRRVLDWLDAELGTPCRFEREGAA